MLTQQLTQINARMDDLETQRNQYDDLTRAVQIQNDTYRTMAIRYETARVEANRNAQKISAAVVIAAPVVPHVPARPRRKLVALATLLVALIAGIGSVLAVEGFDDRFRTPRDVTRILAIAGVGNLCTGHLGGIRSAHQHPGRRIPGMIDFATRQRLDAAVQSRWYALNYRRDWRPVRGHTVWRRTNW